MAPLALGERSVRVRELQRALVRAGYRIDVDGIFGEQTLSAMRGYAGLKGVPWVVPEAVVTALSKMETTDSVVAESVRAGSIGVRLPGCWFAPGDPNTRARKGPPRVIAIHWTGGRRGAEGVCETLRARRLSIGYVLEPTGRVVQCAEDMTRCAHIGDGNEPAIGIECVSMGLSASSNLARSKFLGRNHAFAPWPSEQLDGLVTLCETLCKRWDIPRVLAPMERGVPFDFEGIVGHFNWSKTKLDPGPFPFSALEAAGFTRAL